MSTGGYPLGAQYDSNAPWNKKSNRPKEIEVLVSITMSKSFRITVDDYEILAEGKDEDGDYFQDIDYSNCNLHQAVDEQINLPQEAHKWVVPFSMSDARVKRDLEGWNVDEFEVILD